MPENIKKLKNNLTDFNSRVFLQEVAVSNESGVRKFGTEEFGRCEGLLRQTDSYINVKCVNVNDVLRDILAKETLINVLKIDTEGNVLYIINAIEKDLLLKIKTIFFEVDYTIDLDNNFIILPDYYNQVRYGNTIKLILRESV